MSFCSFTCFLSLLATRPVVALQQLLLLPCTSAFLSHIRKHFLCQLRLHFIVLQQSLARVACASASSCCCSSTSLCSMFCVFLHACHASLPPLAFHWVSGSLGFGLTARLKLRLSIAFNSLYSWRFDLSLTTNRETETESKDREREKEEKRKTYN